jgi:hypothetical protein
MPDPWEKFSVGTPSQDDWINERCRPFSEVTHVTHIANALSILSQRTIRPQLVYDESVLNTRRILVNWVSPNYWGLGFRYGNVAFEFNWQQITQGKNFYWVEVMDYRPKACRILITDQDYDSDPALKRYDPSSGNGPWWHDPASDTHYRNGTICLEFMLEFELPFELWAEISFVKHHDEYCCVDSNTCPDKGVHHQEASGRLLAGMISEDIDVNGITFKQGSMHGGCAWFSISLPKKEYEGKIVNSDVAANAVARSVATAYFRRRKNEFLRLSRLFESNEALAQCISALALEKFPEAAE